MSETAATTPTLRYLSDADREQIFEAALTILAEIGMKILQEESRSLLGHAGCTEDGDRFLIPRALVDLVVESAPSRIAAFDRGGKQVMDLGGSNAYFGTGSDLLYQVEADGTRRQSILEDVARAARVVDALDNLDFVMSFAHPSDVPPRLAYLASFQAMLTNTTKPIVTTAERAADLDAMWEAAAITRGGNEALHSEPSILHYAEPVSPLLHPREGLDKLLLCAERNIPVVYSPAPIAGSSAPMTIAGHIAQGLAESLCGLVLHQLKVEGAPFLMGMGAAVLDMATSQCSYNAPEYYLAYLGIVEMSHHLDLPCWGYAGTSDSQIPDGQAALEATLLTYMATTAGANLNHDVGYLNFGLTGSLEMLVIMDEIIGQARRLQRGIPVNEETLALDVIRDVGPGGFFLDHDHTLDHFQDVQWRPTLISRQSHQAWEQTGSKGLLERATERLAAIRELHSPEPIEAEKLGAIQARVDAYRERIGL